MSPQETSTVETLHLGRDRTLRKRFMVADEPVPGNLRFGLVLEILDKLAEETALAYVRKFQPDARVVTAAVDNILVRSAAHASDDLIFRARINHVGRTSLEVGIRVEQGSIDPAHVASCYFTMVARSVEREEGIVLPPLEYVDGIDFRRRDRAVERREIDRLRREAFLRPPASEEFEMLSALHAEQEERGFAGRLVRDLVTSSWERLYPEQENVPRKIFGGYLIHRAYELAAIQAEAVASHHPVVVAVNRIDFLRPVRVGDKLHFTSRVVYTGSTSVAVEVRIERVSRNRNARDLTNDCVFTFANVDDAFRPVAVPPVFPVTYDEDARYLAAHRRRLAYRNRKAERTGSAHSRGAVNPGGVPNGQMA